MATPKGFVPILSDSETPSQATGTYSLEDQGIRENWEGKCAATVLAWGAGLGLEDTASRLQSEVTTLRYGYDTNATVLYLQNVKDLGSQEQRQKDFACHIHNVNQMQVMRSLIHQLNMMDGTSFGLVRLRRVDDKAGHALGVRKMPFGEIEVMDPNEHDLVKKYTSSEEAVQAIGEYASRYIGFQVDSLEIYKVKNTQEKIHQMTSCDRKQNNPHCLLS